MVIFYLYGIFNTNSAKDAISASCTVNKLHYQHGSVLISEQPLASEVLERKLLFFQKLNFGEFSTLHHDNEHVYDEHEVMRIHVYSILLLIS